MLLWPHGVESSPRSSHASKKAKHMSEQTRESILAKRSTDFRDQYSRHRIIHREHGRWYLVQNGTMHLWVEIITLRHGGLLVAGDGGSIIFGHNNSEPRHRVAWMATRDSAADSYFVEKASIGSDGVDRVMRFDDVVADLDLLWMIQTLKEEGETQLMEQVAEIRDAFSSETGRDSMCKSLSEIDLWEEAVHIGMVPTSPMFHAHAALQRLHHLLTQEEDK